MTAKEVIGTKLVVVESPTKAKTIRKFLGKDFVVESCMGHIRDLPQSAKDIPEKVKKEKWAQLGVNVDKGFEPLYCIPKDKLKVVKNLKDKLESASEIYLATDEDREGESISWHLVEVLKPKVPMKRMVFHEITKEAIQKSLKDTRDIDYNLVRAQEARRILDRLVGYTISPLLWKKVAYGLSAGRVQSVAVRLIVEREHERIRFKRSAYWGLTSNLLKDGTKFEARIHTHKGKRVATGKDFDGTTGKLLPGREVVILEEPIARKLSEDLKSSTWKVSEVEHKPVNRKPAPPFITSTLQQEANRKLGLSSRETMQVAQKLYEQGFITYMRTDSTFLSTEALQAARSAITSMYGTEYLPPSPRSYEGKQAKGAQEAHEAIRPAGQHFVLPDQTELDGVQLKLYDLIWKRTMASQMVDARQKQVSAKIKSGDAEFSASGMTIEFPGFLRAYVEGSDDPEAELLDREVRLPQLKVDDLVKCEGVLPTSHETKPPPRFTEASLVQTMEREGIGRPSTYASVIGTIIDRGYVRRDSNTLIPTFTALVVSKLLSQYLTQYVDLGFTSAMEKSLDDIADGELDWEKYLTSVYHGPMGLKAIVEQQEKKIDPDEARTVIIEGLKDYKVKVGRYGAYMSTQKDGQEVSVSLPESESPADLTPEIAAKLVEQKMNGADSLGKDPKTGLPIYVLTGRFGPYVQLGDVTEENDKPKRASLPTGVEPSQVDLSMAAELLSLPKSLGDHPDTGKDIKAGIGRFGPYIVCDGDFRSVPKGESIFTITLNRALEMLKLPKKGRGRAAALKEFGPHGQSGEVMQLFQGPYGPYIKAGKVNASVPEGQSLETLTKEIVEGLISLKIGEKTPEKKSGAKSAEKKPIGSRKSTEATKISMDLKAKSSGHPEKKKLSSKGDRNSEASSSAVNAMASAKTAKEKAEVLGVKKVIIRKPR